MVYLHYNILFKFQEKYYVAVKQLLLRIFKCSCIMADFVTNIPAYILLLLFLNR